MYSSAINNGYIISIYFNHKVKTMQSFNVPVIPGSDGVVETVEDGLEICSDIGFPVIVKAASGGGGRGMRMVEKESDFENAYNSNFMTF